MSRPKPIATEEFIDKNYNKYEIMEVQDIYGIFYKDKFVNVRVSNIASPSNSIKYKKTIFHEEKKAIKLVNFLNETFSTNEFECCKLIKCQKIKK